MPRKPQEIEDEAPPPMKLDVTALTHIGKVRQINQDAVLANPEQGWVLVADGMGGEKAGEEASAQVAETVQRELGRFFSNGAGGPGELEIAMRAALEQANRDVQSIAAGAPEKRGLGSTASLLCLHRGMYCIAQVGDSRVYLARKGKLRQLTHDHTMVWQLYERGTITREQLETHPERHLLTECIGAPHHPRIDIFHGRVKSDDLFLVCSDGLTGYAREEDVTRLMLEPRLSVEKRAEQLQRLALEAGGGDNVTVVVAHVQSVGTGDDWQPPPRRASPDEETQTEGLSTGSTQGIVLTTPAPARDRARGVMVGLLVLIAILLVTLVVLVLNRPAGG